ncbi:Hint domain-containing protein [Aliiroseovarius sp. S1339]|uniref:Hint domain-containing protein n=1 Tax=Aliiroseovarius sp. S1339 TaxID=2936990 RepID=UPI0020C0C799|nr:Hint domain-containing protein [Aliiroseovarius sp. S1339]MCK8463587.1 Hint domain-containing protein [Aliiroseovarius sp. S1339]
MRDIRVQETIPLHWTGFSSTSPVNDPMRGRHSRNGIALSGLSANTRVETLRGPVAARDLQIGDQVKVHSGGFATLRWVGTSRPLDDAGLPMRRLSADGADTTTVLTADHLVLVSHPKIELLFGVNEVLCPAKYLATTGMFLPDSSVNPAFVHLLFDTYELVQCGDDWVESLMPNIDRIRAEEQDTATEILTLLPKLASHQGLASYVCTQPVLDEREATVLFG